MNPEEILQKFADLQKQIDDLKAELKLSYRQKLRLDQALKNNNTYYVATGATGPNQTPLTFKDGILTSAS